VLVKQGEPGRGAFVLTQGQISVTRQSEGVDMPIGQHSAPAFFGEVQVLTEEPVPVTLTALSDCQAYQLSPEDFLSLLHRCREFERRVFRLVERRLRGLESFIRSREKMAALGTLAAGLAHELNNPAAAVVRAMKDVVPAMNELQRLSVLYGQQQVDDAHTQEWKRLLDEGIERILHQPIHPLELSDREENLLEWLEQYGVDQAWKLAGPLAAGGVSSEALEHLLTCWRDQSTELRELGLRWLAISFDVMQMVKGGQRGAERIGELIHSMKSYSHLDQGAQQLIDVHEGIEDTLRLLSHRLKQGVALVRHYDRNLPQICAYGSELNQVWTNLIDNAIDAMDEHGTLTLTSTTVLTAEQQQQVCITIADTGPGIPPEILSRVFEPFYTTKPVGKGSGLGLDLVRRVVENRHRGTVQLESRPGHTQFQIRLPIR
jgi:signal transduction histidine kinase